MGARASLIPPWLPVVAILLLSPTAVVAAFEDAKLTASDGAASDQFGYSVSISGDTALLGSLGDDDLGSDSGSTYVFRYSGGNWAEEAKLTASDGAEGDIFGNSVSISGDTALVGALGDDDNGLNSGAAYVFRYNGSSWVEEAKLAASDGAASDQFGYSVSISGNTALVGALLDDDNGSGSGSAYVFRYDGSNWVEEPKLIASDAAASDFLGFSVSISGDTALVGAYGDDDNGSSSGSAYLFRYDGSNWVEETKLTASDGAASDFFGRSVSISSNTALIGALLDDDTGSSSGSAYVFRYNGSSWAEDAKLTASDGAAGDYFGYSVSISGDLALIGSYLDDDNGSQSGSAYLFRYDGSNWVEATKLTTTDGAANDYFGDSVSISGNTALVGALLDDDNGSGSGSAYLFSASALPSRVPSLSPLGIVILGSLLGATGLRRPRARIAPKRLDTPIITTVRLADDCHQAR